ncbi:hypothetical protein Tco_1425350, partial [Tanacetum coccineum]
KIIKEQVNAQVKKKINKILPRIEKLVNEKLESEVLIRSSNKAKSSHAVTANLSELELKKILIDKMESNKSIDRSDEQKNLYKALVDVYEADKDLLDTYGDIVTIKRRQDDADDDQEPSARTDRGSKRRRAGKEPESFSAPREKTSTTTGKSTEGSKLHQQSAGQSAPAKVSMHTVDDFEDPTHQEFDTGLNDDQPEEEAHPYPDWFQQPLRLPSLDRDWNKTVPADHASVQPWLSNLARQEDPRESFDELMDTPLDFSAFMINRLKVDTLTPELLVGPTFELMKGTCKSLVELEYFFEEVYKATTEQLDWTNPEGQRYPHDLQKPLPLIPNSRGRQVIPFAYFINNDLAYLSGGDFKPNLFYFCHKDQGGRLWKHKNGLKIWSQVQYGVKYQLAMTTDDKLYSFKEGDFKRLRLQDIEDMLILLVQGKLTNLKVEECLTFSIALRMFTRSIVIQRRVEDLQLGVESYQKKLNITKPDTYRPDLRRREAYTAYPNP